MIFDGSNRISLNPGIRVRDQVRFPTAADGRAVMEECVEEKWLHYSLHYDVSKAHRRVPVLRSEWGRQAFQIIGTAARVRQEYLRKDAEQDRKVFETYGRRREGHPPLRPGLEDFPDQVLDEVVWLNCAGTFDVWSACYWWGRAGAGLVRLTHYLVGHEHALWALLYSDDGGLTGRGKNFEFGLILHLFILMIARCPLAWKKLPGGYQTEWLGYVLDMARFEIGISEMRAAWVINWIDDKVCARRVRLGELREGLGRLQFLAGPLEHLRPFLGPLYSWACAGGKWSRPWIPLMLLVALRYIASELKRARMAPCRANTAHLGEVASMPRQRARLFASADGGADRGEQRGSANGSRSGWTGATRPGPFRAAAFRTIATLELLGALVGVMVLMPSPSEVSASTGLATLTCGTDNQGNSFLLDKLMTTKYPLAVVLMELSCQLGL